MIIELIGPATTTTSRWLDKHFAGCADLQEFITHFSKSYRTCKGTPVSLSHVRLRVRYDVLCQRTLVL